MASYPVKSTSENGAIDFIATGSFADPNNPNTPLTWTGYVTTTAQNGWTGYSGITGGELAAASYGTPNNTVLFNSGFPATTSLAFSSSGQGNATVTDTMAYGFSAPVGAGTQFDLWDPGAVVGGNAGTSTFTFTASLNGKAVDTSGWTFTVLSAQGGNPLIGNYAVNAKAGTVTVTNYNGSFQPEAVVQVTTNAPVDKVTVTATTLGADIWGLAVAAPGSVATESVVGANNTILSLPFDSASAASLAQGVLSSISSSVANNSLIPYLAGGSAPQANSNQGTVQQVDAGGLFKLGGDVALIDDATAKATVFGGAAANESVVSGMGGLFFVAGTGSGQLIASGSNTFFAQDPKGGNWNATFGAGNNIVIATTGQDTITTGTGANLAYYGANTVLMNSGGADTIVGDAGILNVNASSEAATGASTVAAGALVFGGTGGLNFIGGAGVSTVVSYQGGMTVQGGSGGGLFFAGSSGNSKLTSGGGPTTMFGGNAGDVLTATGSAANLLVAKQGNETLTSAGSSGSNTFFAGSGSDLLQGGNGTTSFVDGTGSTTMVAGTGLTLFSFNNGNASMNTVVGWNPGKDYIALQGFGSGAAAAALKTATVTAGSETLTLADGTHVVFQGVASLSLSNFI